MSSGAILENKKQVVAEIAEKMKNSASFILVDYKGINVEQITALRQRSRASGVEYKVYKNTFMRFAAKECGFDELEDSLKGSSAIIFSESDPIAAPKLISDFVKDNKLQILNFKAGVIDGKVESAEAIKKISQLPSREVLLSKMLGSLNAPIAKFVYVVNAIKEKNLQQEG